MFFYRDKKIIVTNAFEKKSLRLPKREKKKVVSYKENYEFRVREGIYYDET